MSPIASPPLEMVSSSEDAAAHGEPDDVVMETTNVSNEKIDALTWRVEQLSNSISETRTRQTRLAEVLEQSLTGIGRVVAESEARVQKILDQRLSRFEEARDKNSEASEHDLNALSVRFEVEAERNDQAIGEIRASLEAIERTVALSEARVEESVDERLTCLEQALANKPEESDEGMGALAARLDVESERNENALSDLRAAMETLERSVADSEARVDENLESRLNALEQEKNKNAEASREQFEALDKKLEAEAERNAGALSQFQASLEAMERAIASSGTHAETRLDDKLSQFELARETESQASEERLRALAAKLDAESKNHQSAVANLRAMLEATERTIASSVARVEESLDNRLGGFEEARGKESEAGEERLRALAAKLDAESEHHQSAVANLRAMLEATERTIASSVARVEESLDNRLGGFEEARGKESKAGEERLGALATRFDVEAERNEAAFFDLRASLEIMERNFAELESQLADAVECGMSLYDQAKKKETEALKGTVENLMKQGSIREAIEMHWNAKKA